VLTVRLRPGYVMQACQAMADVLSLLSALTCRIRQHTRLHAWLLLPSAGAAATAAAGGLATAAHTPAAGGGPGGALLGTALSATSAVGAAGGYKRVDISLGTRSVLGKIGAWQPQDSATCSLLWWLR
jgi:hypothetical protein